MLKKDSLKKLGILGVSFGLMASPLAFAGMEEDTAPQEPAPHEDTMQDDQGTYNSEDQGTTGTMQDHGTDTQGTSTEYEEEEQEFTYEEEEEEQEDWDTDTDTDTDTDSDDSW